jgi:glycosyltransferase involved in cell wall biosynthesis
MKKVLVVGMLDSIHLARWLSQFQDQQIDFTIYPSTKFRNVHAEIIKLVNSNKNYHLSQKMFLSLYGYKEYFFDNFLAKISKSFSNSFRLNRNIMKNSYDFIHALEIQGAGYLLTDALQGKLENNSKIIITNWGSDIYFFERDIVHKAKIQATLKIADFYSAECHRDYELALKNGFLGKFLPVNPNAGGFSEEVLQKNVKSSSDRNMIIAKCYGGLFGLGEMIIQAVDEFMTLNKTVSVFFYSVTADLEPKLESLIEKYPARINFSTVRNKLSIIEMYEKFSNAKIYLGASKSDGISTSFLEALVLGAYPIQTNTACGSEWVDKGFNAHLIETSAESIIEALIEIDGLSNLEEMRLNNKNLAAKFLSFDSIKQDALLFYGLK